MEMMEDKRSQLLSDITKMLVDYDRYVEDKHHLLIHQAKQMVSATPLEMPKRPEDFSEEYWKYSTNPAIRAMANSIVAYILNK